MKKILASIAIVFAVLISGCSQGEFADYESPDGVFSIKFPGEPKINHTTEPQGAVTIKTDEYTVDPKYAVIGNKYTVIVTEIVTPTPDAINFDMDLALKGARDGIKKEGGTVQSQKEITHNDIQGWEFESTSPNGDSTIRFFMEGLTFFVIEVARKPGKNVDDERDEFFESFTIN